MLPRLTAVQFKRFMESGRTSPALCGCEDGAGRHAGEYVVKLRGAVGVSGLRNEVLASRLALHFGMASPDPALVSIEPALIELVASAEPTGAAHMRGSAGLNYGSRVVTGGAGIWPVDRPIPEAMWQAAVNIFAFDALVQNPDRSYRNPNLFARGDALLVFDHETAFSFDLAILPSPEPWRLAGQPYLTEHVFYRRLKARPVDLTGFTTSLCGLSDSVLAEIAAEVPDEWNNNSVQKIERHLRAVRDRAGDFAEEIQRFLA